VIAAVPTVTESAGAVAPRGPDPDDDGGGEPGDAGGDGEAEPLDGGATGAPKRRRRRGSRGGRSRSRRRGDELGGADGEDGSDDGEEGPDDGPDEPSVADDDERPDPGDPDSPEPAGGGDIAVPGGTLPAAAGPAGSSDDSEAGAVTGLEGARPDAHRPRIGDTRPAPVAPAAPAARARSGPATGDEPGEGGRRRRRRGGRGRGERAEAGAEAPDGARPLVMRPKARANRQAVEMLTGEQLAETDPDTMERRRGRERKGRPVGRYLMAVHSMAHATQIAVLEGRMLIEHYVSRPQDDANQIDGNIYLGRVQNVLPGMEAAFIDIGTPKNAVLYRGDLRFDAEDVDGAPSSRSNARIEQLLRAGQMILCQVTKNPIAHKGARLTQEVSLPGRFVVFIPNSATYGISKRLSDDERKRLRRILDDVKPADHGLIVRTAAEGASADELRRDVARLASQWQRIEALARQTKGARLLYREPDLAVRVIREEFNKEYRGVVIDDPALYEDVREYVASISPELADRVELYDEAAEGLPIFERHHVHEQLHKAIDRKVWLPSGGSLIIERTEALTVIDVNTGKNVGTSNLEETVYRNNLEAADEIARQLRLRDIGGIIVIDFIDMDIAANRADVVRAFRDALARDKTRTQVFDISELGLVEMTRKRVSEGLVESLSTTCPTCEGRGIVFDRELLEE